ncbi:MAG: SirB2 family protein [Bermanella sp.]
MALESIYLPLKHSHIMLVLVSIIFFSVRASAQLLQKQWQTKLTVKISAHSIDTLLLLTGLLLMLATAQYPIAQAWLSVKMLFLVGYIAFGIMTMKTPSVMKQRSYFAVTIVCALLMFTIARTHHPLGMFSLL